MEEGQLKLNYVISIHGSLKYKILYSDFPCINATQIASVATQNSFICCIQCTQNMFSDSLKVAESTKFNQIYSSV